MSVWVAVLILVAANLVTVTAMLLLRSRAPSGSFFQDTQQAAGVFAVVGTTFAGRGRLVRAGDRVAVPDPRRHGGNRPRGLLRRPARAPALTGGADARPDDAA